MRKSGTNVFRVIDVDESNILNWKGLIIPVKLSSLNTLHLIEVFLDIGRNFIITILDKLGLLSYPLVLFDTVGIWKSVLGALPKANCTFNCTVVSLIVVYKLASMAVWHFDWTTFSLYSALKIIILKGISLTGKFVNRGNILACINTTIAQILCNGHVCCAIQTFPVRSTSLPVTIDLLANWFISAGKH